MLKGYRTVLFNIVMAIVAMLQALGAFGDTKIPTSEDIGHAVDALDAVLVFFWGLGNIILRYYTTTQIGKKE